MQTMILTEKEQAIQLHTSIMASAQAANTALQNYCQLLKEMRDKKLYKELGFEDFGEYAEKAVGVGQRQAYNYIKMYEELPSNLLEKHGEVGVTKLLLLAQITPTERAEFAEENNLAELSVADVKKLVEEKNGLTEQITLLKNDIELAQEDTRTKEQQVEELQKEVECLKSAPPQEIACALVQPDESTIAQIRTEEQEKAKAEIKTAVADAVKAEKEKAKVAQDKAEKAQAQKIEDAVQKVKTEQEALMQEQIAKAVQEKEQQAKAAQDKADKLAKQLEVNSSADTTKVLVLFEQLQTILGQINTTLEDMRKKGDAQQAEKLDSAVKAALQKVV